MKSYNQMLFNRYAYAYNSPLNYTDNSGHCTETPDDDDIGCWKLAQKIADEYGHPYEELIQWNEAQLVKLNDAYQKTQNENPYYNFIDLIIPSNGTLSVGASATGGSALYGSISVTAFDIDSHGNISFGGLSLGGGALLPQAAEVAITIMWTDADNVDQLGGWSMMMGGSAEMLGSVGFERVFFKDPETGQKFTGGALSIGIGEAAPIPAEAHVGVNFSWSTIPTFNIYSLFGLPVSE